MGVKMILAGTAALLLAGCSTVTEFNYPPAFPRLVRVKPGLATGKSVAVEPFQDFRGKANDISPAYLYLIPLCPFGYIEYERPEHGEWFPSVDGFQFEPSAELARAAAVSLKHSGLFRQVSRADEKTAVAADYILRGGVISTYYKVRLFSYGLSFEGPWLWLIGLPAGTSLNRLSVCLWLVERQTGRTVWTYAFEGQDYISQGLYFRYGRDTSMYSVLMAESMNCAVMSLEEFFAGQRKAAGSAGKR